MYYTHDEGTSQRESSTDIKTLANACSSLTMVIFTSITCFPYHAARITRRKKGKMAGIKWGKAFGMQFGSEDEAFPD